MRLVDTAGLRKRAKVEDKLERLSAADTKRAIDYAEVVVLLLDATRGLEVQDLRIANQVIEEGRGLIIAVNKWDVAEHASSLFNGIKGALDEGLAQLRDVPLLTVSAKTGKGMDTVLKVGFDLREAWSRRIPTGELNRWFEDAIETNPPPAPKGQRIKLRYITQVKSRPPTFVVFGNRLDELSGKLPPLPRQRHAARLEARAGAAPARIPQSPQPVRSCQGRSLSQILRFAVSTGLKWTMPEVIGSGVEHLSDELPNTRRLGAFREEPDRTRAGLYPNPQLFPRRWGQVDRPDRAGDARAEYHRAGAACAHDQRASRASSAPSRWPRSRN